MSNSKPSDKNASVIRRKTLIGLSRFFLIASLVAILAPAAIIVLALTRPREMANVIVIVEAAIPAPTKTPVVTPTPQGPAIALVAGHSGADDPGASCPGPNGMREVDVTTDVAKRVKTMLETRGRRVEILTEFDPRLNAAKRDYSPSAFLSIHADSCVYNVSGFKVARAALSAIPQEEDRLVRCITVAYGAATQLSFHSDSITPSMTHYHGLDKINPQSPGAIIEVGFLGSDGEILKNRREAIATGIADGLDIFLRGNACQ